MLFSSYIFLFLFLPLVLLGYYGLNHFKKYRLALAYVTVMSMWFCGYTGVEYLVILLVSIVVNFLLVEWMSRVKGSHSRKVLLVLGLLWNIGLLFCFKYYDFFIGNINEVFRTDIALLRLVLPLGISFYTFQQLSYVIDYYRGDCEKYDLLEYTAYVTFFPKLIQGPLASHTEVISQLRSEENRRVCYDNLSRGIYAFALGLAKKVLIADTFSPIVTLGYDHIGDLNSPSALLVMICYALQLYFDFSGYCDMAYGIGLFFNVELPLNFNSPYQAESVRDFWDRWHMTLTRFFTKYLYIPMGGSRKGMLRTYLNVLIVFLVSGLWHGANWTFILWGALHGICSVLERTRPVKKLLPLIPKAVRVAVTFLLVTFAWSLFRADSIAQAKELWHQLFHAGWGGIYAPLAEAFNDMTEMKLLYRLGFDGVMDQYPGVFVVLFTLVVLAACFFMRNTQEKTEHMHLTNGRILVTVGLMVWSILSMSGVSAFLYVNF